jgi:5'-phosphate synthase pdxT subunit
MSLGGESTTLNIFLREKEFIEALRTWMTSLPAPVVWGTCAGMILLSDSIEHQKSGGQLKVGPWK